MYFNDVKQILIDVLALGPEGEAITPESGLLGTIPELDSMAVVNLIAALESHFGIVVEDDEISASTFETAGSLADFVAAKLA
ncbi:acyl carrier protein [Massilia sp. PAMC28688]|uniref:acyl carrier protein n=1 Tax=Massilia sp. PAMC28688 TaxID=2861283 RepID=UPI001C62E76E|nr:acyl carrier protein [Massilia sp. PAMC28688]QYF95071.1 acyl carrier protein [Massilia sp. PAMC28688]